MPHIAFTAQLQRFTETPALDTCASTLAEALAEAFQCNPRLKPYILDEQGHLRPHVVVFIEDRRAQDRTGLSDPLRDTDRIYVLQALTGG